MLLGKIHSVSRRKLNHFYFFWGVVIAVIFGYFRIKAATTQKRLLFLSFHHLNLRVMS